MLAADSSRVGRCDAVMKDAKTFKVVHPNFEMTMEI